MHTLKGAALTLGATGLGEPAAELERTARTGDQAAIEASLTPVANEIERLVSELAAIDGAEATRDD